MKKLELFKGIGLILLVVVAAFAVIWHLMGLLAWYATGEAAAAAWPDWLRLMQAGAATGFSWKVLRDMIRWSMNLDRVAKANEKAKRTRRPQDETHQEPTVSPGGPGGSNRRH